jgi:lysine-arginine-ornithine-binding protein
VKIFATLFSLVLFAVGGAHAKDWSTIRIAVEGTYPPYNQLDSDGKVVGFDIDIANALCTEIKAKCSFVVQDWDGMIPALIARKFDAIISSMSITEERKQRVAFTGKYYNNPSRWIVRKGGKWEFTRAGLANKTVGVPSNTIFDRYVTGEFGGSGIKIVRYAQQENVYLDLAAGRIDATVADPTTALAGFLKTPQGANFEFQGPPLMERKYFGDGAAIATRKTDLDLRDKLDAGIMAIRANGKYEIIRKKYFDFDIWGE